MTIYRVEIWGDSMEISADFSQAASQIELLNADGEWESTQYQVADFGHDAKEAMRALLNEWAGYDDSPRTLEEIEYAIDGIEEVEEEEEE